MEAEAASGRGFIILDTAFPEMMRCDWKCAIAVLDVLAEMIPSSDTSSRAFQHQIEQIVSCTCSVRCYCQV